MREQATTGQISQDNKEVNSEDNEKTKLILEVNRLQDLINERKMNNIQYNTQQTCCNIS